MKGLIQATEDLQELVRDVKKAPRFTPALKKDLQHIMRDWVQASCSCNSLGLGNGFLGHSRNCWVHLKRTTAKRIYRFLDKLP